MRQVLSDAHPPYLELVEITKRFGSFVANEKVSLKLESGTFHALLGENGAGKSTLVKCLMGYHLADEGEIIVGQGVRQIRSPYDAHKLGIGMVYQHFTVVPAMTVAENLLLARPDLPPLINWSAERKKLTEFLATAPFKVDLNANSSDLAAGQKQKVEMSVAENFVLRTFDRPPLAWKRWWLNRRQIRLNGRQWINRFNVKTRDETTPIANLSGGNIQRAVLARKLGPGTAKVLVVANPCMGLDFGAVDFIHSQLLEARNREVAILLLSEDLDELVALSDRIVVMAAGKTVYSAPINEIDRQLIGEKMASH